ncbi:hypothetical protein LTR78_003865 [Recurvomyces mirabilis]|uniref:Uncharacterized protein n=1 Tax=Recurvomyces mirabilis TaxID=574656 RepID=A0AAE0WQH1_9PEZI|nr:hypothetical protein LTR78_003865 [Recurvomyces mirabilis]KAK5153996.1 hypothetical protein LTS14_007216 [Recurvomyces mirabilis]
MATKGENPEDKADSSTSDWCFEPFVEAPLRWEAESKDPLWNLRRQFPPPGQPLEKSIRPERSGKATRAGSSPLRTEVRPEEISTCDGSSWDDDWGDNYVTLGEELEKAGPEKPDEVRACEAEMAAEYKAWLEESPDEDENRDTSLQACEMTRPFASIEKLPEDISCTLSSTTCTAAPSTFQPAPPCAETSYLISTAHPTPSDNTQPVTPMKFTPPHLRSKTGQSITARFVGQATPIMASPQSAERKVQPPHLRRKARTTSMRRKARDNEDASLLDGVNNLPAWHAIEA